MAPLGTGNSGTIDRNKRERERYMLMSDTIDKLRVQLKLNTRYQTPILEQTLAALIRLKKENKAKKLQLEQLCAELGLPTTTSTEKKKEEQKALVPIPQKRTSQQLQLQRPAGNIPIRPVQPAWILPDGRIVPAGIPSLPQRPAPALMNPMLIQGYHNPLLQQQFLMQAMLAQGALANPRIL